MWQAFCSDHLSQIIEFNKLIHHRNRNYKYFSSLAIDIRHVANLQLSWRNESYNEVYNQSSNSFSVFGNTFQHHLQKTCQINKTKIFTNNNNLWVTTGIRESLSTLKQLRCDFQSSKSKGAFVTHYKRIYEKVIRLAVRPWNKGYMERSQNKRIDMWNTIKRQTGQSSETKSTGKGTPTGISLWKGPQVS